MTLITNDRQSKLPTIWFPLFAYLDFSKLFISKWTVSHYLVRLIWLLHAHKAHIKKAFRKLLQPWIISLLKEWPTKKLNWVIPIISSSSRRLPKMIRSQGNIWLHFGHLMLFNLQLVVIIMQKFSKKVLWLLDEDVGKLYTELQSHNLEIA